MDRTPAAAKPGRRQPAVGTTRLRGIDLTMCMEKEQMSFTVTQSSSFQLPAPSLMVYSPFTTRRLQMLVASFERTCDACLHVVRHRAAGRIRPSHAGRPRRE